MGPGTSIPPPTFPGAHGKHCEKGNKGKIPWEGEGGEGYPRHRGMGVLGRGNYAALRDGRVQAREYSPCLNFGYGSPSRAGKSTGGARNDKTGTTACWLLFNGRRCEKKWPLLPVRDGRERDTIQCGHWFKRPMIKHRYTVGGSKPPHRTRGTLSAPSDFTVDF